MNILILFLCVTSWVFGVEHATVSIYAVRTDTGKVVIDKNSETSMVPASCMKLVTTAAALELLGAEKRFETCLEYDGIIDQGRLCGNLYIHGGGDPCLGSERIAGSLSWKKQIEVWADAIQSMGITTVEGRVIADASKWEKARAVPSWAWEDLGNYYGAGASALSFHENAYSLVFKPGNKIGDHTAILRTDPPLPTLMNNEVTTGPEGSGDGVCIYGSEFSPLQVMRGTVPAAVDEFTVKGAIPDPSELCAALLTQAVRAKGVVIEGKEVLAQMGRTRFHTTLSPTVGEIVHWTNQKSINLYAEHLLKSIGEKISHEGSTEAGLKAVTHLLGSQKIDLGGFSMMDGSGLSRKNLITAKQLVSILVRMKKSAAFPIFFRSLPDQGGCVRAKTGSMSLIRGAAGYAGEVAFAILINHGCDSQKMKDEVQRLFTDLNRLGL